MTVSTANVSTQNLELTPCRVTYKGVDLGGTLDNVLVSIAYSKADIMADQFAETILDKRVSGLNITVTTAIAEVNLKDNWKVVFPNAQFVDDGGNKAINFVTAVGAGDFAQSGILLLHPLSKPDVDLSTDHKFFKAISTEESEFNLSPTEQSKLSVVWTCYPDTSQTPAQYYFHGDPAAGLINASAAAPVPDGGNTGDGTVTGVTVFSGITVSETITLTLVTTVVNGGIFHVEGSVSGSLGLATVGIGFVSSVIAFTINDGAADFVLNDSFTIVTTSANYS